MGLRYLWIISLVVKVNSSPLDLLSIADVQDVTNIPDCQDEKVLSCVILDINWNALENPVALGTTIVLPTSDKMTHKDAEVLDKNTVHFVNEDGDVGRITFDLEKQAIFGTFRIGPSVYHLDSLIDDSEDEKTVFVWKEIDTEQFYDKEEKADDRLIQPSAVENPEVDEDEGVSSRSGGNYVASVIFYFTHEAAHRIKSLEAFAGDLIAEANDGFKNSKIPLRVKIHCIKISNIKDGLSSEDTLDKFSKSGYHMITSQTRRSADIAMLVVENLSDSRTCGLNWIAQEQTALAFTTAGLMQRKCGAAHTFGHEIAHGFGCVHNYAESPNQVPQNSHGKIFKAGRRSYATIMAYARGNVPINYYSDPDLIYKAGVATGTPKENCGGLIKQRAREISIQGNERTVCEKNYGIGSGTTPSITLWSKPDNQGAPCGITWTTGTPRKWTFKNGKVDGKRRCMKAYSFTINRADRGTKIYFGDKNRGDSSNDYLEIEVRQAITSPRNYKTFEDDIDDGFVKGYYKEYDGWLPCLMGCGLTGHMSVASVSF